MSSSEDDAILYVDNKGGKVALFRDYQYHLVRKYKSGASILRCSKYRKSNCRGSITIKDSEVINSKGHSCVVDKTKNVNLKKKAEIKERVINSDEAIPQIYKDSVVDCIDMGLDLIDAVPSFSGIKTSLYNARNRSVGAKKTVFKNLKEVEIPQKFKAFLLAEYTSDDTRIFIFCTNDSRLLIPTVKEAFIDSTFKSCPKPFKQLLSIHGDFGSTTEKTVVRPLIFALLSNKKQKTYDALLRIIKIHVGWNITKLHCDYEIAFINAVTKLFPETVIVGCYYHWNKNVWKMGTKRFGHRTKLEKRIIGMCAVLPLLPANAVVGGWAYIKTEFEDANLKMDGFMKYVQKFVRKESFVPIMCVFAERHRTNNVVESWHSTLNKRINKNMVTVLRLLNVLVKIDKYNFAKHLYSGGRKPKYIINDDFIRNVQLQYINGDITIGYALEKLR